MTTYKKLEIIINLRESTRLRNLLHRNGINAYSYWDGVKGRGERGLQDGEGLSDAFINTYFVIACPAEDFDRIREKLRNLLREVGGVCMISEVDWLLH